MIVEALYIKESARQQGVGKKLLQAFENWANENYEDFVIEITHIHTNENAKKLEQAMNKLSQKIEENKENYIKKVEENAEDNT